MGERNSWMFRLRRSLLMDCILQLWSCRVFPGNCHLWQLYQWPRGGDREPMHCLQITPRGTGQHTQGLFHHSGEGEQGMKGPMEPHEIQQGPGQDLYWKTESCRDAGWDRWGQGTAVGDGLVPWQAVSWAGASHTPRQQWGPAMPGVVWAKHGESQGMAGTVPSAKCSSDHTRIPFQHPILSPQCKKSAYELAGLQGRQQRDNTGMV